MKTETPQLVISRVYDAPRELVYRAFTDPDHLAAWWGPTGNSLPRDEIEFDVRPGGFQRWTEVNAAEPELCVQIHVDLTDVADGELLEGVMHVSGRPPDDVEPFERQWPSGRPTPLWPRSPTPSARRPGGPRRLGVAGSRPAG
jgi:uncharacterized protein YndB with AHSA1/START domain